MIAAIKKVPAFCGASHSFTAGSPLSSQAERPITPPTVLSFQSDLSSMMPISSISRSQTPLRNSNKKEVWFERRRSKSVNTIPESSGASSNEDSDSESVMSTSTDVSEEGKIPKPEGEPGRPGRGGYNLERAVNWPAKDYKRLKVCTETLFSDILLK